MRHLLPILCISSLFASGCATFSESYKFAYPKGQHSSLTFIKEPEFSVVGSGINGFPMLVSDPFILRDEMGFHLFYATVFCKKGDEYYYSWDPHNPDGCDYYEGVYSIGYAFSADKGLTWEFRTSPLIMPGSAGWENRRIETPNVVRVGDELYLFYCAEGTGKFDTRYQIGVATLSLNERSIYEILMSEADMFDRNGRTTPLIPKKAIGHFDMNVQEPSVVYRNNYFEVYYIGLKLKKDLPLNGRDDLITDIGMGKAVFDEELQLISRSSEPILQGVNIIELVYSGGEYHLFYTAGGSGIFHKDEKIAYSVSRDGKSEWSSPAVVLTKGSDNSFDNWGVMAPALVRENNKFYLFYNAWEVREVMEFREPMLRWCIYDEHKCAYGTLGRSVEIEQ